MNDRNSRKNIHQCRSQRRQHARNAFEHIYRYIFLLDILTPLLLQSAENLRARLLCTVDFDIFDILKRFNNKAPVFRFYIPQTALRIFLHSAVFPERQKIQRIDNRRH